MKKIRKYVSITAWLAALMLLLAACKDDVSVHRVYSFDFITMPVAKRIEKDKTVEIHCQLVKEGEDAQAEYFIRYLQVEGTGEMKMDGTLLEPGKQYPLKNDVFLLYYTSRCMVRQTIELYIEDNFGQSVKKAFTMLNDMSDHW